MRLNIVATFDKDKLSKILPHVEQALTEQLLTPDEAARVIYEECVTLGIEQPLNRG